MCTDLHKIQNVVIQFEDLIIRHEKTEMILCHYCHHYYNIVLVTLFFIGSPAPE